MNKNYFTCPRCGTNLDYDPTPAPWQTFPAPQDIKTEAERIQAEYEGMPAGHHIVGYIKHSPMEAAQIGSKYSPVVEPDLAPPRVTREQIREQARLDTHSANSIWHAVEGHGMPQKMFDSLWNGLEVGHIFWLRSIGVRVEEAGEAEGGKK